jgi:hypothetical protein
LELEFRERINKSREKKREMEEAIEDFAAMLMAVVMFFSLFGIAYILS